jgi:sulfatase modifying factor 1
MSRAPDGMVRLAGGGFAMGAQGHYPEEAPIRRVEVEPFSIDMTLVTNHAFARFVEATGWVTLAETPPDPEQYPGLLPEMRRAGSLVFTPPSRPVPLTEPHRWWSFAFGADWRHPTGPGSSIDGLADHPVVHVAYVDAQAYARWAGKALPSEAQWEFAARGGLEGATYAWGEELRPHGVAMARVWQGEFPWRNLAPAGMERTSPVAAYPANGYGLYDMIGNVWEWTSDGWAEPSPSKPCCAPEADSYDPATPDIHIPRKVLKGGSHLCAPEYCRRYRPAARYPQPVDTSTSHVGFRCAAAG